MAPLEVRDLVAPGHTALVTQECQNGVIGPRAVLPQLAEVARDTGMIDNVAELARSARKIGIPVVHCTAQSRADGLGGNRNARLFVAMRKAPAGMSPGSRGVEVLPEIGVEEGDLVLPRYHGLSPMSQTGLDPVLRNMGVSTIVGVGVSVNVAMLNFAFDAVNAGYQMVIPRDAVAGVPRDYADAVFEHTFPLIATVPTTAEVLHAWGVKIAG